MAIIGTIEALAADIGFLAKDSRRIIEIDEVLLSNGQATSLVARAFAITNQDTYRQETGFSLILPLLERLMKNANPSDIIALRKLLADLSNTIIEDNPVDEFLGEVK